MSLTENILRHIKQITHYHVQDSVDKAFLFSLLELFPISKASVISLHYADKVKLIESFIIERGETDNKNPSLTRTNKLVIDNEYLNNCLDNHQPCFKHDAKSHDIYIPVLINDKPRRVLRISLDEATESLIEILTSYVAVYRNHYSLIYENEHDTLTGLLNRKTFDDKLNNVLQNHLNNIQDPIYSKPHSNRRDDSDGQQASYWLGLIDIDFFKKINDNYGHLYGDEVLLMISHLMRKSFRINDMLFRYGGEEFIIILDQTSKEMAYKIFERFRKNVEQYSFPQVNNITISIGMAQVDSHSLPRTIVDMADQALYYAKDHGRNQTCDYTDLVARGELKVTESNDDNIELF